MKEVSRLLRKIIKLQRQERVIPKGSKLLIAFSGGVDSVVLCDALLELREFLGIEDLALAHYNHGLRGQEALRDEEFSVEFARQRGLKIFVERGDVKQEALRSGGNLEETARKLRYGFLRKIKDSQGFELIATAHHLNDLLETSIIWLTRGAALEGLLGFEPRSADIVRPLYLAKREEILSYAKAKNLGWVEDSTNADLSLYRNKVRHRILPLMKEINPNLEETFLRTREILRAENQLLKRLAQEALERAEIEKGCLSVEALRSQPLAIQRRVIGMWLGLSDFRKIEMVRRLLQRGGRLKIDSFREVVRKGKRICVIEIK